MPDHVHEWKRSTRPHGRPPRYFVECTVCGEMRQATETAPPFQTNRKRGGSNVIAIRVNDAEFAVYNQDRLGWQRRWRGELDGERLQLPYNP